MRIARESGSRVSTPGCRSFFGTTVPRAMTVLRKSTSQTLTSPHSNQLHNASPARPLTRSGRAGRFLWGPPCASLGIPRLRPLGWFGSPHSGRNPLGSGTRESSPCEVLPQLGDERGKPHGFRLPLSVEFTWAAVNCSRRSVDERHPVQPRGPGFDWAIVGRRSPEIPVRSTSPNATARPAFPSRQGGPCRSIPGRPRSVPDAPPAGAFTC